MIIAGTITLLVLLAGVFSYRWRWGVYSLLFALPFELIGSWALNPDTGHPVVRISHIVAAAWLLAVLINIIFGQLKPKLPPKPTLLLLTFILSACASFILVGESRLISSYVIFLLLGATSLTLASVSPFIKIGNLLNSLYAGASAVSMFGLYQFVVGALQFPAFSGLRAPYVRDLFGFPRVHSTALEPLYFANYLLIPLIIGLVAMSYRADIMNKWWHKAAWSLIALNFILTMSRGAIIALVISVAIGLPIALVAKRKPRPDKFLLTASIGVLIFAATFIGTASHVASGSPLLGPVNYIEQLTTKLTRTGSFYDREAMRDRAIGIFQSNPVFGVGIAGITPYIRGYEAPREPGDVIALNNQFFELLAETGLVGATLFYMFLIWSILAGTLRLKSYTLSSTEASWTLGLILVLCALTIQAQSFSGFLLMHFWVIYGLLLGSLNYSYRPKTDILKA